MQLWFCGESFIFFSFECFPKYHQYLIGCHGTTTGSCVIKFLPNRRLALVFSHCEKDSLQLKRRISLTSLALRMRILLIFILALASLFNYWGRDLVFNVQIHMLWQYFQLTLGNCGPLSIITTHGMSCVANIVLIYQKVVSSNPVVPTGYVTQNWVKVILLRITIHEPITQSYQGHFH